MNSENKFGRRISSKQRSEKSWLCFMMLEEISLRKLWSNEKLTSVPMYHHHRIFNSESSISIRSSKKIIQEFIISQDYKKQKLFRITFSQYEIFTLRALGVKIRSSRIYAEYAADVLRWTMRSELNKLAAVRGRASGGDEQWRLSLSDAWKNVYLYI